MKKLTNIKQIIKYFNAIDILMTNVRVFFKDILELKPYNTFENIDFNCKNNNITSRHKRKEMYPHCIYKIM